MKGFRCGNISNENPYYFISIIFSERYIQAVEELGRDRCYLLQESFDVYLDRILSTLPPPPRRVENVCDPLTVEN